MSCAEGGAEGEEVRTERRNYIHGVAVLPCCRVAVCCVLCAIANTPVAFFLFFFPRLASGGDTEKALLRLVRISDELAPPPGEESAWRQKARETAEKAAEEARREAKKTAEAMRSGALLAAQNVANRLVRVKAEIEDNVRKEEKKKKERKMTALERKKMKLAKRRAAHGMCDDDLRAAEELAKATAAKEREEAAHAAVKDQREAAEKQHKEAEEAEEAHSAAIALEENEDAAAAAAEAVVQAMLASNAPAAVTALTHRARCEQACRRGMGGAAVEHLSQALSKAKGTFGEDDTRTVRIMSLLTWALEAVGRIGEAIAMLRRVKDAYEKEYTTEGFHYLGVLAPLAALEASYEPDARTISSVIAQACEKLIGATGATSADAGEGKAAGATPLPTPTGTARTPRTAEFKSQCHEIRDARAVLDAAINETRGGATPSATPRTATGVATGGTKGKATDGKSVSRGNTLRRMKLLQTLADFLYATGVPNKAVKALKDVAVAGEEVYGKGSERSVVVRMEYVGRHIN